MIINKVEVFYKRTILYTIILLTITPLIFSSELIDNNSIQRLYFSIVLLILALQIIPFAFRVTSIMVNRKFAILSLALPIMYFVSSVINKSVGLLWSDFFLILSIISLVFTIILLFNFYEKDTIISVFAISLSIVSFIIAVIGVLQNLGLINLNLPVNAQSGATLIKRNFAVEFITISYPWVIVAYSVVKKRMYKNCFLIALIVILFYLFILRGRAGYLAAFISTAFGLYYFYRYYSYDNLKKINKVKIIIVSIILIVITVIGSINKINPVRPSLKYTLSSLIELEHPENSVRLKAWVASVKMIYGKPIFGVGTAKWAGLFPKHNGPSYTDSNIYRNYYINPHNDYLEILSENGIISLVCYLLLLLLILFTLFKKAKNKLTFLLIGLSAINFMIIANFYFTKDRIAPMMIFSILLGITGFLLTNKFGSNWQIKTRPLSIILIIFLIINVIFCFNRFQYEKYYIKGIKYKMQGKYVEMLSNLERINLLVYPLDPSAMPIAYYIGVGHYVMGKYNTSLNHFLQAQNFSPESPLVKNNIGSTYFSLNDWTNAENIFLELKETFPNYIEPQINLLAVYTNNGKHSRAKKLLIELSNKTMDNTVPNKATFDSIKIFFDNN